MKPQMKPQDTVPKTDVLHLKLGSKLIAKLSKRAAKDGFKLTPWVKAKLLKAVGEI